MRACLKAIAVVTMLAATGSAIAQERPGMPPVEGGERSGMPAVNPGRIEADPDRGMKDVMAAFAGWSRRTRNPKILLFWNVALTDESSARYRTRASGEVATVARPGVRTTSYDHVVEQERSTGGPAAILGTEDNEVLESGFVSAFVRSGANLVDRAALMRKVSTKRDQADRTDQQFIEALAMEQGVDYLVEVLPNYRAASGTGMSFAVKILHLPSSRVLARFNTEARPSDGPERLVARPGGFRRERVSGNTPERVAETLASETMRRFL